MKLKNCIEILSVNILALISVTTSESVVIDDKSVEYIRNDGHECPFALDINNNVYITSKIRLGLCHKLIGSFKTDLPNKCFEDTLHALVNPCYVECMQTYKNSQTKTCSNANDGPEFLITNLRCGENHYCSTDGCCVESITGPDVRTINQSNTTTAQTTQYTTTTEIQPQPTTINSTPQDTTIQHTSPKEPQKTTLGDTTTPTDRVETTVPETTPTNYYTITTPISTPTDSADSTPFATEPPETSAITEDSTTTQATTTAEADTNTVYITIPSDTTPAETTAEEVDTTSITEITTPSDTTPAVTTITANDVQTTSHITSMPYYKRFLCEREGNFTDEDDSHSYIHCNYNITHNSCAAGTKFDEQHSICDDGTKTICKKEGRFRNRQDCTKFYFCIENSNGYDILLFNCPESLVFDETIGACNYKSETNNCDHLAVAVPIGGQLGVSDYIDHYLNHYSDHKYIEEYIDKSNEVVVEEDVKLLELFTQTIQCVSDGYYRNPYDCHKFYQCFYDDTEEPLLSIKFYRCVNNGYYFDSTTGICQQLYDIHICDNELEIPELSLLPESLLEYYY